MTIDIFYQGHGLQEMQHIEISLDHTVEQAKLLLIEKHGWDGELLIFAEDHDQPLEHHTPIREICGKAGAKLHLHRCREVEVFVTFTGETKHKHFAPGVTLARIRKWAGKAFGMSEEDVGEHGLQLAGTHDRPATGTHIGSLAHCPVCKVKFDLVPEERVNG